MATKKYILTPYDLYDVDSLTQHFEKQAKRGWFPDKSGVIFWRFRKAEPKNVKFTVTHFEKYTPNESAPDNGQAEYLEMCAAAGWELVYQRESLMVFATEKTNPLPIETEPLVQVENIHKSVENNYLGKLVFAIIILGCSLMPQIDKMLNGESQTLFNWETFLYIVLFICTLSIRPIQISFYNSWYKRAKIVAKEENRFLSAKSSYVAVLLWAELMTILLILLFFTIAKISYNPVIVSAIAIMLFITTIVVAKKNAKRNYK